ncbi:MAG: hypothetical protein N2110_04725 [Flavobacteriales bacterium]|nr:hypothetical protein [Flavobacteriales bacterium]
MKGLISLLLGLLCGTDLGAQVTFARTFGGPLEDGGYGIAINSNGHYVGVGYTGSFSVGASDAFLVCVNALGSWQWQRTYGGVDADALRDIAWFGPEGYAVGYTKSQPDGKYRGWLLALDTFGDTLFTRCYEAPGWMWLSGIVAEPSGLYLCGTLYDSLGVPRGVVLHTDFQGQIIWEYRHPNAGLLESSFEDITVVADTLLATVGQGLENEPQGLLCILRKGQPHAIRSEIIGLPQVEESLTGVSFDGTKVWFCGGGVNAAIKKKTPVVGYLSPFGSGYYLANYFFSNQYDNVYTKIYCFGNDDYYVTGKSHFLDANFRAAILLKYVDDNLQWGVNIGYHLSEGFNAAYEMLPTSDGGIITVGEFSGPGPGLRALLFWKVDDAGQAAPHQATVSLETPAQEPCTVMPASDGLILKCGTLGSGSQGEVMDIIGRRAYSFNLINETEMIWIPENRIPKVGIIIVRGKEGYYTTKYILP